MESQALFLTITLAFLVAAILTPLSTLIGHVIKVKHPQWKLRFIVPLALLFSIPAVARGVTGAFVFKSDGPVNQFWLKTFGSGILYSFESLLLIYLLTSLPVSYYFIQRGYDRISTATIDAAKCSGLNQLELFRHIELPYLIRSAAQSALLTIATVLGEFGIALMVGGDVVGHTRTLSIAVYTSSMIANTDLAFTTAWVLTVLVSGCVLLSFLLEPKVNYVH
jgi:molybdate transport system permease protein